MKKVLASALSVLLAFSTLAIGGCSQTKSQSTSSESSNSSESSSQTQANGSGKSYNLVFWTFFSGGDGDVMTKLINTFNASSQNVKVKNVLCEWGDPYYTKLETAVAAGNGPDIGVSHITALSGLVDHGALTPLDDYVSDAGVDWNVEAQNVLKSSIFNGKHYSIPLDTHPYILYYNKDLLQKAGMLGSDGTPNFGTDWDSFTNYLVALKGKLPSGVSPLSFPTNGVDGYRLWWTLYKQLGGNDLVNADCTAGSIDKQPAIDAAQHIQDLFQKDKVVPLNLADFLKTFQSQKAALMFDGVWGINSLTEAKINFGVMPVPKFFNNNDCWADSHNIVLPKQKSPDKDREVACVKFMYWATQHSDIWAEAGHIPTNVNVDKSDTFNKLPMRSNYVGALNDVAFPRQNPQSWAIQDNVMIKALDPIWAGRKSPEDVFNSNQIDSQITTLLNS